MKESDSNSREDRLFLPTKAVRVKNLGSPGPCARMLRAPARTKITVESILVDTARTLQGRCRSKWDGHKRVEGFRALIRTRNSSKISRVMLMRALSEHHSRRPPGCRTKHSTNRCSSGFDRAGISVVRALPEFRQGITIGLFFPQRLPQLSNSQTTMTFARIWSNYFRG